MSDPSPLQLTSAQWRVVSIALKDAGSSRCGERSPSRSTLFGRVRRIIGKLAGIEPCRPLADQRLEALRSFVWSVRRVRKIDQTLLDPLLAQGFTDEQIEGIKLLAK